jgi:hypothetical protein
MKNKYNFTARAALFVLALTAAFTLNAIAQAPPGSLWYNGDFNGVNGLANERNTTVAQAGVYDDFIIPTGQMWHITGVFSDNLASTVIGGADWEIRSLVSEGNSGTLQGGTQNNPAAVSLTGRSAFGFNEYQVLVSGLNLTLGPGTYWLNVTPVGNGTGRSFNSTTSGTNCVGTPCGNNMNAFFNSTSFGYFFTSTGNPALGQPSDFSNGVIGTIVPEPATVALLTCGVGALLIAVRRRRSS